MTRPAPVAEIRLCGCVVARKARGPGYVVGEPYPRSRSDAEGEERIRPGYYAHAAEALFCALGRADALTRTLGAPEGARELLWATAGALTASAGGILGNAAALVRGARSGAGLTKSGLARRAGCSRTTVRDVEAGRTNPQVMTLARLLAACEGG
jgi:DNA-binding XRE family transcriptional regulator